MDGKAIEIVEFGGWPNCIRLSNGQIELVTTTDVGPRIIRLGFVGGQNLFKVFEDQKGLTGGDSWRIYGGHRLWHAPEIVPRTYAPDNTSVDHAWDGKSLTLRTTEPENRLDKEVVVTLSPDRPQVGVVHRITNRNPWAIELAAWVLSVMAQGGEAICPQEPFFPHPDCLVPARPVVLWHFTDMSDPRWTWGRRYIRLRQDRNATTKEKVGLLNKAGWAAYLLNGEVFVKRYTVDPSAPHADMGSNTELFTDKEILEVETLSPLVKLEPGQTVEHRERWLLGRATCGPTDEDVDANILPLVDQLPEA